MVVCSLYYNQTYVIGYFGFISRARTEKSYFSCVCWIQNDDGWNDFSEMLYRNSGKKGYQSRKGNNMFQIFEIY